MNRDRLFLLLLSTLLFVPFLGSVHLFDWDEINFAESAREMLETGNFWQVTINYEPFREKPPLFFWMQALSMTIFGVGEFAARLPNAICGIITLQVIYSIGLKWQNQTFAWVWVLLYIGSFLPHLYFKSGIIDPWFNLFIFLSIYQLFITMEHPQSGQYKHAALSGLFSGFAILTKGPVGLLLLLLTFLVWWILSRLKRPASLGVIATFAGVVFAISSIWFGYETIQNGPWFLIEFVEYQVDLFLHPVAGHKQPFFYHFLVVLIGCFPMSIIALSSFRKNFAGDTFQLSKWMKYLFWVVLILFSIVTTKIVHYSSMTYLPLSYLASLVLVRHLHGERIKKWQFTWVLAQGSLLGIVFILVPILLMFKSEWIHLVKDPFAAGNLSAPVVWLGWEWLAGLLYLLVLLFVFLSFRAQPKRSFVLLTGGTALTISLVMILIVPKIEGYSQRSAIKFFENHAHENAHFITYGYKSYAHYFYGKIDSANAISYGSGIPKKSNLPYYISVKINKKGAFEQEYPQAEYLYEQGGFVFYEASGPPYFEKGNVDKYPDTGHYLDENGVAFYVYGNVGAQRNPLFIAQHALWHARDFIQYKDDSGLYKFNNSLEWLETNLALTDSTATLVYDYDVPKRQLKAPWYSGLANSRFLDVLRKAHELTGDNHYIELGDKILNHLLIPTSEGGAFLTLKNGDWWFAEYASQSFESPFVLNGMISVVFAVKRFTDYTSSKVGNKIFEQGIKSIEQNIHRFNNNGISYYALDSSLASPKYYRVHMNQLDWLIKYSDEPLYRDLRRQWVDYHNNEMDYKDKKLLEHRKDESTYQSIVKG